MARLLGNRTCKEKHRPRHVQGQVTKPYKKHMDMLHITQKKLTVAECGNGYKKIKVAIPP
jgi:hypothetical protein